MKIDFSKLNLGNLLDKLPTKEGPFDVNWQLGQYFFFHPLVHNSGNFELYFGKKTKFKKIARLRVFSNDSNTILDKIDSPWKVGAIYHGDTEMKCDNYRVVLELKDNVIQSVDIIDDDCVKENNGYYKSLGRYKSIQAHPQGDEFFSTLIGAWEVDVELTENLNNQNGIQVKLLDDHVKIYLFYRDESMNMHTYLKKKIANSKYGRYYKIGKITKVKNNGDLTFKAIDLKFGDSSIYNFKLSNGSLLSEENIIYAFKKIGSPEDFLIPPD